MNVLIWASGFVLGLVVRPYFERWNERRLIAQLEASVPIELVSADRWALAFYDDLSGLWAVGKDTAEAQAAALAEWHDKTPPEICEEFGDVAWLAGLRLVELRCDERVLREVVLPSIEGARQSRAPWGYPAVGGGV